MKLNQDIITTINKYIPSNIKLVPYLMDKLQLSKESVYRRIKGDVPFTFDEMSLLSTELEFSLDEVLTQNYKRSYINLPEKDGFDPVESFLFTLRDYYGFIKNLHNTTESHLTIVMNQVLPVFMVNSELLFKITYFKWLHQTKSLPPDYSFSDFVLPAEINDLRKKINYYAKLPRNITLLIDREIYISIIREIQYFYRRKLIPDKDLLLLKNELLDLVKEIEEASVKGSIYLNNKFLVYISAFDIISNMAYADFDGKITSYSWPYPVYAIISKDPDICGWHKSWIDSLIEYSTLITKSNDMLRVDFFKKQYDAINNMDQATY